MVDWSELLPELVFEIAKGLNFYEDFVSFSNVCSSWRSAIGGNKKANVLPSRFPSMMVVEDDLEECKLYVMGGKVHKLRLPDPKLMCWSSTGGWLLIIEREGIDPKLFNPFSGRQIDLPKFDNLPGVYPSEPNRPNLNKVLISSDPSVEQDFVVMIIWGCSGWLAFCRPGDSGWTPVKQGWMSQVVDICYHKGMAYTFDGKGFILSCDVHTKTQTPTMLPVSKRSILGLEHDILDIQADHILPWDYEKLLVVYHRSVCINEENLQDDIEPIFKTLSFWVFECDLETGEWSKVDNLGNRSIFVGRNSSFSIDACGYVKSNCIYFTDNIAGPPGSRLDLGIYDMSDGSIEPHFDVPSSVSSFNEPMWIEPPRVPVRFPCLNVQ